MNKKCWSGKLFISSEKIIKSSIENWKTEENYFLSSLIVHVNLPCASN